MSENLFVEVDEILDQGRHFLDVTGEMSPSSKALEPSRMWRSHLEHTHRKAIREVERAEELIELTTSLDFFSCPCLNTDYYFDGVRREGLRFFEKPGYQLDSLPAEICESEFTSSKACFDHHGRRLSTAFLWHLATALRMRELLAGKVNRMMEIGSGYGGLARIMKLLNKGMTYYLVDLPECLVFAHTFLKKNFPEASIHLVTDGQIPESGDFVLIPTCFVHHFPRGGVDLVFNSQSFSEMTADAFHYYIDFIQNHINPKFFYNVNRYLEHADGLLIEGRFERGCSMDACSNTAILDEHWNVLHWALSHEDHCASWDPRFQRVLELLVERIPQDQRSEDAYARKVGEMSRELKGHIYVDSRWHYLMWNINRIAPSEKSLALYIEVLETQGCKEAEYYMQKWMDLNKKSETLDVQNHSKVDTRCYPYLWSKFLEKKQLQYLRRDLDEKPYLDLRMDEEKPESSFKTFISSISESPKVSIFMFCKDRRGTIRKAMQSIASQSYPYLEIIVQDGASTDGTLDVLQQYGKKIQLVSEKDSGPAEAFWTALKRCTGDIIGSCLSDEELLPNAVTDAVDFFLKNPSVGALTRDGYLVGLDGTNFGEVLGPKEFDIKKYMANEFAPHFCASFFSRKALEAIGLREREWVMDCGEFELWCRLALEYTIAYKAGHASKYAFHDGQLSRNPDNMVKLFRGRAKVIERIFLERKIPDFNETEKIRCMVSTALSFADLLKKMEAYEQSNQMMRFCQNNAHRLG